MTPKFLSQTPGYIVASIFVGQLTDSVGFIQGITSLDTTFPNCCKCLTASGSGPTVPHCLLRPRHWTCYAVCPEVQGDFMKKMGVEMYLE